MNPKEEIFIPGEHHFYSRRPKKDGCPAPGNPPRGKFGLASWIRENKPQAMTFLNLIVLLPLVFFLYPFLLEMADKPSVHSLGPLEITTRLAVQGDQAEWTLGLSSADPDAEGTLEVEVQWGESYKKYAYFYSSEDSIGRDMPILRHTFQRKELEMPLRIKCRWGTQTAEWEEGPLN